MARPYEFFQSRYTIALCFSCLAGYRAIPPPKGLGVSHDYASSMLLVSQLKLPSHSYGAIVGDRSDWTTGGPYDGNAWRKYRVVPRAHPLHPLVYAFFKGLETKGLLDFQGRCGITSVLRWNLRPVISGVDIGGIAALLSQIAV